MYQPRPNMNWNTYQVAPPSHGIFFGPPPVLRHLKFPGNLYSLCPSTEHAMAHGNNKHPQALIPTLYTAPPGGQQMRPHLMNLAPMNRPPPSPAIMHRPPHLGTQSQANPAARGTEGPHWVHIHHNGEVQGPRRNPAVATWSTAPNSPAPLCKQNPSSGTSKNVPTDKDVVIVKETVSKSSEPATGRKRSASPSSSERNAKRQREVTHTTTSDQSKEKCSPPSSPKGKSSSENPILNISTPTPEKPKRQLSVELTEEDKEIGLKISPHIENWFQQCKQSDELLQRKMHLRDYLYEIITPLYPYCGLYMVGSSMTGLAAKKSDLDLCLVVTDAEIDQTSEALVYLRVILRSIRQCKFILHPQLIQAKVPILNFVDSISGVEVDLNVNNMVGIRNTQLISCYSRLDARVPPLCLLVKLWAKEQNINDPYNKTLSSYSLILMVLHYLQFGCKPPVLPCLHSLMPNHFSNMSDVSRLMPRIDLPPFSCRNRQNLGELLLGFFQYYGCIFNFKEKVISVRVGGILPKEMARNCRSPKNRRAQWNYLCIEEPFDRTNTARAVFDESVFNRILETFRRSLDRLRETQDLQSVMCSHTES